MMFYETEADFFLGCWWVYVLLALSSTLRKQRLRSAGTFWDVVPAMTGAERRWSRTLGLQGSSHSSSSANKLGELIGEAPDTRERVITLPPLV